MYASLITPFLRLWLLKPLEKFSAGANYFISNITASYLSRGSQVRYSSCRKTSLRPARDDGGASAIPIFLRYLCILKQLALQLKAVAENSKSIILQYCGMGAGNPEMCTVQTRLENYMSCSSWWV